jgi:hypothetical protein
MRPAQRRSLALAILAGGLIAGALDIADALIVSWLRGGVPIRVLKYIVSGVIGPEAMKGGTSMAALGLFVHFVIAAGAAAVYVGASRVLPVLLRRPVFCGLLYGLCVYFVMQYVIVPLSLVTRGTASQPTIMMLNAYGTHLLGVGLPIALCAAKWAPRPGRR